LKIGVIIVNWNGADLLKRCLEALTKQQRSPDLVVIVDNASTDDSLMAVDSVLPGAHVIRLDVNAGFARGNNLGLEAVRNCDLVALLNPDAFPSPQWLRELAETATRNPQVDSFASLMRLAGDPARLDGIGDSYHVSGRAWRNGHLASASRAPDAPFEVFAPCAAAALYRRSALESVGAFDEEFFCYFEDVDLGFRLRLQGRTAICVPSAVVDHVSSGTSGYRSDFAVYHGERNMVWTFFKDMPGLLFWRYLPQHLLLNVVSLLYYPLRGQGRAVWRAKWDALKGLPAVLEKRRNVQANRVATDRAIRSAMRRGLLAPYLRRYT